MIATNGAKFDHPSSACLARIVVTPDKPAFYFNDVTDHIADVVAAAGWQYWVRLPARRGTDAFRDGIIVQR